MKLVTKISLLKVKLNIIRIILLFSLFINNTLAYILTTPDYQSDNLTNDYINQFVNTDLCSSYTSDKAITLKQAINITVACNRNIHKLLINRISENYGLDVAQYKFKPNMSLHMAADYYKSTGPQLKDNVNKYTRVTDDYSKSSDSLTTISYKTATITPQFNILTPIGTTISLDWENYTNDASLVNTFRNASHITIKQPLLKQSGYKYQTASVKNSQDSNRLQLLRLYDSIEDEINKTIFIFRSIIQNKNQLEIQQKTLDISKKLLEQTKILIKTGRLAQYELSQVESQVASQEVNLADAKINLKRSYLQLANQLGINKYNINIDYPQDISKLPEPLKQPADKLLKISLENNINYQSLITQQKLAQRDYYHAYDQSRWNLDLVARYNLQGYGNNYSKSIDHHFRSSDQNGYYGIQFDIPIDFNPNRNQALVENKIRLKQLELDKKQLELEIYSDLQDKIYQNKILWDKLQLAKKSVEIKQNNFKMAKKKYESGRLSSFELVRIQDDVESARVIENSNLIAYLNNYTIIDKILNNTLPMWNVNLAVS